MQVSNYKCDICGRTGVSDDYNSPDGWISVSIQTKDKDDFWYHEKDVCNACSGLIVDILRKLHE